MRTSVFRIDKMDCPTEERMLRARLEPMTGVESLDFNLMARTLSVTHTLPDESAIVSAIGTLGMDAVSQTMERARLELPVVRRSFWRSPGTILTVVSGLFALTAEGLSFGGVDEGSWLVRALAAVAIVCGGYETAGKAWRSLRTFTLNINFLMMVAAIGAVVLGEWTEAAMVIFLFAVAELVEAASLDRARNAIRSLMELAPESALVLRDDAWRALPVDDVRVGEIVRIKPGERLPLDGVLRHGGSAVNQAPITGEAMPVEKLPGDRLFAGSINGSGTFDYEVTHCAADSTISRIIELVEKGSANRARAERFVDRFARYYTPTIVGLALLAAIVPPLFGAMWGVWIYRGLVLLVIGCPCALVISTPVTIVSGLAAAARRGILVKGGLYLELGGRLKGIALDKTGTLTEGRPRVTDIIPLGGLSPSEIIHLAAAVEARSEHPIASAIVAEHELHHRDEPEVVVTSFEAIPGMGIRAMIDGRTIHVGNQRLAHDLGLYTPELGSVLERLEAEGKSMVVVMREGRPIGAIGVADRVRESSVRAVARLHELGLRTAMLTGDNITTATAIARSVGIDDVRADLLPKEKLDALAGLQAEHGEMGMVGDGVNDAPALAQSTIGFAMGAIGTDAALEAADVALMEDNLGKLPEFVLLSRRTIRVLWQNILIALGIKFIFFALALVGDATLWMAVFADMGASLIVVANGLRMVYARSGVGSAS